MAMTEALNVKIAQDLTREPLSQQRDVVFDVQGVVASPTPRIWLFVMDD